MMPRRIEDPEVKPAQPISAADLHQGSIYFFVNFIDEEMLIPTMRTMVYIGENLEPGDKDQVYFQDIDSVNRGVEYLSDGDGDNALFETGSKYELGHVFDFDHALDVLLGCSIRRKKKEEKSHRWPRPSEAQPPGRGEVCGSRRRVNGNTTERARWVDVGGARGKRRATKQPQRDAPRHFFRV